MLGDEPWESLEPVVVKLLEDKDENKQRGAAEFLAGLIGGMKQPMFGKHHSHVIIGSKNWPLPDQEKLWNWITPQLPKILGTNVKSNNLSVWTSFLEYVLGNKDPRRAQPIVDYIIHETRIMEYNQELSLDGECVLNYTY
jgi:proteasome activator subunit 4